MTIAICDDERVIGEQIERLVKREARNIRTEVFTSAKELLQADGHFDMLFLDIRMPGINGIEAAKVLRDRKEETVIIFITGVKEYVFEAFDVAAFHYLLKPVNEKKFTEVFARARAELEKRKEQDQMFCIKCKGRRVVLHKKEILYVESQNRMVTIHTAKETVEIYFDMKDLEKQLGENFYRCHRGYIVNMGYIEEYEKDSIRLINGEKVYLSRRKYKEFVKAYMDYLRNGGLLFEVF